MINLCFIAGSVYIFNKNDVETLRRQHRIVGELSSPEIPALPLLLLPEEVVFLVNKDIGRLIEYPELRNIPNAEDKTRYEEFKNELLVKLGPVYKELREAELKDMIDNIVANKRNRSESSSKTREQILKEEMDKVKLTEDTMLWPIFVESQLNKGPVQNVSLCEILQQTTSLKCAVFEDLWDKNYYITTGSKFGGDFLAYLDDPIGCHAVHIIRCVENERVHVTDLIAFGRLGHSTKKTAVLASSTTEGQIDYTSLTWT